MRSNSESLEKHIIRGTTFIQISKKR